MSDAAAIAPITEWPAYDADPRGGDPLTQNVNSLYNKGDLCWMLVSTMICWQITPAIGFLYAGMHPSRSKSSSLTMVFQSLFCACACGIQFWIYGYSLYESHSDNHVWGNMSLVGLHNVLAYPSQANADIPDILYAAFGMTFVTCTAMILAGALLVRGRLFPSMIFLLCWTTFVYYVLAYWEWNPSGWLYKLGVYDFAGSGPVHIASGFGALACSLMLGPSRAVTRAAAAKAAADAAIDTVPAERHMTGNTTGIKHGGSSDTVTPETASTSSQEIQQADDDDIISAIDEKKAPPPPPAGPKQTSPSSIPMQYYEDDDEDEDDEEHKDSHKPHNPFLVAFGTVFIWFGWFSFNGASTANLSIRSIYVVVNTNLAACGGGMAWCGLEYLHSYFEEKQKQKRRSSRRKISGGAVGEEENVVGGIVNVHGGATRRRTSNRSVSGKFSIMGFCSGVISGLVGITPAAGFIPVYVASLIGAMTATCTFYVARFTPAHKTYTLFGRWPFSFNDGLDIFAIHGVGGIVGDILTGVFAANFVPALDGVSGGDTYPGGWWEGRWEQVGYQLAAALTCASWSFAVSCVLLFVIGKIPGLHLRVTEDEEDEGLDVKYLSDYCFDGRSDDGVCTKKAEEGMWRRYAVLQSFEGVPVPVRAAAAATPAAGANAGAGPRFVSKDDEVKRD